MSRRNQRGAVRRSFTKIYNEMKGEMEKEERNQELLRSLWAKLDDRVNQLAKLDDLIMKELCEQNVSEAEMDEEYESVQEYRDKWSDLNLTEKVVMPQEDNKSAIASVESRGEKSRYKLPKLKLVEFSGSVREWLAFWSQFKGIHEDEHLSSEDKFQYLIQSTVVDSDARRVVSSFPPTAENYEKAIQHLKSRFGKENVLVEVYVRDLLKLVLTNINGQQRLPLATLYDKLETQLRSLETLGVTSDKCAAMLYPLVESSLSQDVLIAWERIRNQRSEAAVDNEDQLKQLMKFLQGEVESSIRLKMAKRGVTSDDEEEDSQQRKQRKVIFETVTTTDLLNKSSSTKCIFCGKGHQSYSCVNVDKLSMNERFTKIREAKKCFKCLKLGHFAWNCKASLKCPSCNGNHYKILCTKDDKKPLNEINLYSTYTEEVIMQTLLLNVNGFNKKQAVRTLLDGGSGRSYITSPAVKNFGLERVGTIELAHALFGGHVTNLQRHSVYNVDVSNIDNTFRKQYQLIEVEKICNAIEPTQNGPWLSELKDHGIQLSDEIKKQCPIHMLFGANITSKLYTGNLYETTSGPVAFETKFGWTLTGTINNENILESTALLVHTMYVSEASIQDLWNLDIIGIHDPVQEKSKEELAKSALIHFEKNIARLQDGRYEVALPWIEGHQPVAVNREVSERRLKSSILKLENVKKLELYQKVFDEWLALGIIEEVEDDDQMEQAVSYLPHHPVFNDKSFTTPIRPVFDASAKSKGFPSLNDCLEKGQNLLNDIPALLILFRMKLYAAISDIKKAFLQISVCQKDRNYLRFLWYKDGKKIVLRHCRVVFGISSSPFLLAATINHHLERVDADLEKTAKLLKNSIFVDNCVVSVDTREERDKFIIESTKICAEAKFELRGWVWNRGEVIAGDVPGVGSSECGLGTGSNTSQETSISVLGLLWNVSEDTISLDTRKILHHEDKVVSKRVILAATHQIFDPIGIATPIIIVPKILLQELHKKKFKWDTAVPEEIKRKFLAWKNSLELLSTLKIPRWVGSTSESRERSLHIFTDASKKAYTAVAFLRSKNDDEVSVQLLLAKSRIATIKPMTTPRLELVACECGAKMAHFLQQTIDMKNTELYFWSDSGNALSWIKRKENWQVFVFNRVKIINQLSNSDDWLHIPGHLNPADLPSRGCNVKQLLDSKWWEGPDWLRKEKEFWPRSTVICDEKIVMSEKKKVVVSHLIQERESMKYFRRFSDLRKVIRMIAWMKRWMKYKRGEKRPAELSVDEENEAETSLWRMIQRECFENSDKLLTQMKAKIDETGLWRVETKLLLRNDTEGFRRPILLPKNHVAVDRLVEKEHLDMHHCGPQILRCNLRERYWILDVRRVVRRVQRKCKRCTRYAAKNITAPEPPLPSNRVRDATNFEVVGIDLGGPLYLSDEKKSWFVIFTCAVYRAVHIELITSLSTPAFIQALRRFIARRGRPAVIYTDNGKNFVGTENLMEKLNWKEIAEHSETKRIKWIFNPPSAPWWGGWWERIVGMIKKLLRKRLGRDVLDYEEMATVLCDCEQLINSRPLTYLSEDQDELMPITPMMFLNEAKNSDVVDLDKIESTGFGQKFKYRQEIRQELRERFRKEYLSLLVHRNVRECGNTTIKVGDVVIMEVENKKRVDWPLAKVVQVFPGQDKVIRSVKIRLVKNGKAYEIDRPIQRLYMLESSTDKIEELIQQKTVENTSENQTETTPIPTPTAIEDTLTISEEVQTAVSGTIENVQMASEEVQTAESGTIDNVQMASEEVQMTKSEASEEVQMTKSEASEEVRMTRRGRKVNKPNRYNC